MNTDLTSLLFDAYPNTEVEPSTNIYWLSSNGNNTYTDEILQLALLKGQMLNRLILLIS